MLGRWHSQDPLIAYASPYNGIGNNPVNLIDHMGMFTYGNPDGRPYVWQGHAQSYYTCEYSGGGGGSIDAGFGFYTASDGSTSYIGVQNYARNAGDAESMAYARSVYYDSKYGAGYGLAAMRWENENHQSATVPFTGAAYSDITGTGGSWSTSLTRNGGLAIDDSNILKFRFVGQSKNNWCLFACAKALSKFFGGSTKQIKYANTFYKANGIEENSDTPVSLSSFVASAMNSTPLAFDQSPTMAQIQESLCNGYPVLANGDINNMSHAFIITGYTIYSDGTATLNYMNPGAGKRTMTYQQFLGYQNNPKILFSAYSITGMQY